MMNILSLQTIESKVYIACKLAFSELIEKNREQNFYSFGIWTDDGLQFMYPAANTEEAHKETAARYCKLDAKYNDGSFVDYIRWSAGDWAFYGGMGSEHFEELNGDLCEIFDTYLDLPDSEYCKMVVPMWDAMIKALKRLDNEGFFGVGEERQKVTLLIVGDIEEETIDNYAKQLNPLVVANSYINHGS